MHKLTKRYVLYLLLFFCAVIGGTIFIYLSTLSLTKQSVPVDIIVGDYTGINLDADALHFGTLKPGTRAERFVILRADQSAVAISLKVEGVPFIIPEKETLFLEKGQTESVRIFAVPDKATPKKKYEGRLIILSKAL